MKFDIIVLGGGHAGLEAAWIAHQFDLSVAIVTLKEVPIASAPCNPAIGGVGKGQVVRELDALGGLMGKLADLAGIQYRTLNGSKGYAVQSTRVQIDKDLYEKYAQEIISSSGVHLIFQKVISIKKNKENSFLLEMENGEILKSSKLIITAGTFFDGKIHRGKDIIAGGRVGHSCSLGVDLIFKNISKLKKRFKTGTPPRLIKSSIDFSKMKEQKSDGRALSFHYKNLPFQRNLEQVSCFLTHTNEKTLSIIRKNKKKSPLFNGQIKGIGPRYCPSIEDKAYRYEDRDSHHIFIEPEGLNLETFYPNGISTSLPPEIQLEFIQTIEGLEDALVDTYGYAVEYDVIETLMLNKTMEYRGVSGLYFAGQVCGTSGYEEAAAQGYIAGVNAAQACLRRGPFILKREESYIGVMIDDLTGNDRDEPYRLFTARAENRLFLREDNAILRMAKYRKKLNLSCDIDRHNQKFLFNYDLLFNICEKVFYKEGKEAEKLITQNNFGPIINKVSLGELLRRAQNNPIETLEFFLSHSQLEFDYRVLRTVAIGLKYHGYIQKEEEESRKLGKIKSRSLDWRELLQNKNISHECKVRIEKVRPENFGELQRIKGIRPATLAFVAGYI